MTFYEIRNVVEVLIATLAQLIVLVTYGNDFFITGSLPSDFDTLNTTFQFCNTIDFRVYKKKALSSKTDESVIAKSPTEWFEYLKNSGCKRLGLYYKSSEDQSFAKDHKLAGLVGGGGVWLIEALFDNHCNYWASRWEVTQEGNRYTDKKIWGVNYAMVMQRQYSICMQIDEQIVKSKIKNTLEKISDFAHKQNLTYWAEQFDKSMTILDKTSPNEEYYHSDLIPLHNYPLIAQQILFSAGVAWVFGGMGSWNDLGFDKPEDQEIYDRLSEQLYSNIIEAIIAGVNTFDINTGEDETRENRNFIVRLPRFFLWLGITSTLFFGTLIILMAVFTNNTDECWVYLTFIFLFVLGLFFVFYYFTWKLAINDNTIFFTTLLKRPLVLTFTDITSVQIEETLLYKQLDIYIGTKRILSVTSYCRDYNLFLNRLREERG